MLNYLIQLMEKISMIYLDIFIIIAFTSLRIKGYIDGDTSNDLIINTLLDLFLLVGFRVVIVSCFQSMKTGIKFLTNENTYKD